MPAVIAPIGQRVIVQGVSWATYTSLVADFADSRGTRMAYDQGTLEFMSSSFNHEQIADFLVDVVKAVAEAQGLDFVPAGSMTCKRDDVERGFEPDASFYLQHAAAVQGQTTINLDADPPPDMIIEVDLTHPSLDKFPIYAALGVPEVWRYVGHQVLIYRLVDAAYQQVDASMALAGVTPERLTEWVLMGLEQSRLTWIRRLRAWSESLVEAAC